MLHPIHKQVLGLRVLVTISLLCVTDTLTYRQYITVYECL